MQTKTLTFASFILVLSACAFSDGGMRDAAVAEEQARRDVYSGEIGSDPAVQRQWRDGLNALEARCREAGEFCAEAEAVRETLSDRTTNPRQNVAPRLNDAQQAQ
jgi:hypothetical protein